MGNTSQKQMINFLRGVPAEEVLSDLIETAADGYKRCIAKYGTDVLQYGHFNGFAPLRELIAADLQVDPNRVIVGNGGMEVISLFFKSLPPASHIVVEACTYDRVVLDAQRYGHQLVGVALTDKGVDLDQLRQIVDSMPINAFYGIPFHQNPTGINYSRENIQAVETICRNADILCAWDICYETLRYDGQQNQPIPVSDWGPILISSYTKTIAPGTKCGYIVVPTDFVDPMMQVVANTRINPNLPTQAFIADFIESGQYRQFLNKICDFYRPRMVALNEAMAAHFPEALPAPLTGGFFACLTLGHVAADRQAEFIQSAAQAGVGLAAAWNAVAPDLQEEKRGQGLFVRLTFPPFDPEQIRWGVATLAKVSAQFN